MSDTNLFGHGEFIERIAAYLAGGLEGSERTAFDEHRDSCAACAAELGRAQEADGMLVGMFANARPEGGFEDRIVRELRTSHRPRSLPHPAILKVASGVAAAILVGAVGYVGNYLIENNKLPGAAKVAQHETSSGPAATRPQTDWFYDSDWDKSSGEKGLTQGVETEAKLRELGERSKDVDRKSGATPQDAQGRRWDTAHWGRDANGDGTVARGRVVNGEIDALRLEKEVAREGKPQSGSGGDGGRGYAGFAAGFGNGGAVRFGEPKADDSGLLAFGVDLKADLKAGEANQPTSLGLDGVTGSAGATATGTAASTLYIAPITSPAALPSLSTTTLDAYAVTNGRGENRQKLLGSEVAFGAKTPVVNRYYQPMNLSGIETLGDAIDSEPKALKKNVESFRESGEVDEKAKDEPRAPKVRMPVDRAAESSKLAGVTQAASSDSTGVATAQPAVPVAQPVAAQQAMAQRKIIRNGEMEFEVDSFDTSYLQISKIVGEEQGFVSSTNSEKLPNGKVRGTVVVRVPPEHLDTLVLKLRALGDLKSQKISAQDVTKVYYDLESELKAGRAMEERLLNIIKSGKGEIKDLLAAEKELGVYRNKIEKLEGEIRYYNNLVSFSTLSITSVERDIRKAAFASQTEQVNMGIESEDVEKARADALKAIDDAKGRVIESNLKKFDAGQLAATIACEVAPDAAGPLIDRLRQLGRVARLDIERKQTTNDGTPAAAPQGLRVEKKDTQFSISMYNLANIAPRQTTNMNVAVPSVEDAYRAIIETVRTKNGRVVTSSLNRQKPEQTTATISFEVPAADADATLAEIRREREVMMLTVTENPDTNNVTAAKRGFSLQIFSMATVAPRETESLILASRTRVADSFRNVLNELRKADARILQSQLNEQDKNNVGGILDFEVTRAKEVDVRQALGAAGDLVSRTVSRSSDTDQTVDSKIRLQVRLMSFDRLVARETQTMEVASRDVAAAYHALASAVAEVGGRVIRSELNVQEQNNVNGILEFEVRREDRDKLQKALESAGTLFSRAVTRAADNVNTVESKIRMQVHLTHIDQLPPRERTKMLVEVADVDRATSSLIGSITAAGGRVIDTEQSKDSNGQIRSHVVAEVPLGKAADVRGQIRTLGTDRINESSTNHQAPEGEVARAQFDVTLANADLIVGRDEGLGAAVKSALSTSVRGLLWSLQFIVIGLLIVGPWALLLWGGWKLWRRSRVVAAAA
ncbi:MAG TPA: DUF4349 domain-containing protein [Tepidisphaeraceae bacterium]|nr:DUF4349 domain-containing protein [Tepidisphaeraceae bacterium]